jgi:formylglycine-generating enzyme required for sulfatase activity
MWWKISCLLISFVVITISGDFALADCPSADRTGDCFVDFRDFAVIGAQWLNGYDWNDVNTLANQWLTGDPCDPCVPADMVLIGGGEFLMGDHFNEGMSHELPVHLVKVDSFYMSRYETTNRQYCDFLNAADVKVVSGVVYASTDSSNSYPYCDTHSFDADSQIDYSGGVFSVRTKPEVGGRNMFNDPMVQVSWYGAVGYCNWRSQEEGYEQCYNASTWQCDFSKKGYRLPTEAEWEYAARGGEHSPYYRFPWGDTISHSQANYRADPYTYAYDVSPTIGYHPDWYDRIYPYTSVVGSFSPNGYGLYDMAGNVCEWCNDWYDSGYYNVSPYDNPEGPASGMTHMLRGGDWFSWAYHVRVGSRGFTSSPFVRGFGNGFRVVLDLE